MWALLLLSSLCYIRFRMKKRYAPNKRLFLGALLLADIAALIILLVAVLPALVSAPASDSAANPTATTVPLAALPTHSIATATTVPVAAVVISDTATPPPVVVAAASPSAQPDTLLPDPAPGAGAQPNPTSPPPVQPTPYHSASKSAPTKTPDPNLLPNGVRYGDHKPNLPDRIVRIASPNVKLDTSVYEVYINRKQNLWEVADYAAGHNYNSKNPGEGGNIVLSGHNNWRGEVFRYLEFLKPGDLIQLWTLEGKEYDYRVTDIQKLKEAGVSMAQRLQNATVMNPTGHEQLTLITCWPYTTYTHRLIVTALPVQ
jgi:sortase A